MSSSTQGGKDDDQITGTAGDDLLSGDSGNDTLSGGAGNDTILGGNDDDMAYGGAGNDSVAGDAGNDTLWGEDGNDTIIGDKGNDLAFGGRGNDTVSGGAGNDTVVGEAGNDSLSGGQGDDLLIGGSGNDIIDGGTEQDKISGGSGNDSLSGGAGNDTIFGDTYSYSVMSGYASTNSGSPTNMLVQNTSTVVIDLYWIDQTGVPVFYATIQPSDSLSQPTLTTHSWMITEKGSMGAYDVIPAPPPASYVFNDSFDDTIDGGDGADVIHGELGSDLVYGGTGDDAVYGGAGNDTIYGGAGNDVVYGGSGDDFLWGDDGNDTLVGEAGNDSLFGGQGNDTLIGGDGDDVFQGQWGNDAQFGGAGNDSFQLSSVAGRDTIYGGENPGDEDRLIIFEPQATMVTYTGSEMGSYTQNGAANSGEFYEIERIDTGAGNDTIDATADSSGTRLYTGSGDDSVTGGSGADEIYASSGKDTVWGGAGNDTVYGGDGNDQIFAGAGNDVVYGGAGGDKMYGGDGADRFVFENTFGADTVAGGEGGFDSDSLDFSAVTGGVTVVFSGNEAGTASQGNNSVSFTEIEGLSLGAGNDSVDARAALGSGVTVDGGAGNDRALGSNSHDVLSGGEGADFIDGWGGNDTIFGGAGGDSLHGGDGSDSVSGGEGDDSMTGWTGNDALYGGTGNDRLSGNWGNDIIDGGDGFDTAIFEGPVDQYSFGYGVGGNLIVTDSVAARDGVDTLSNVEYLEFNGVRFRLVQGDNTSNTTLQGPDDGTPDLIIAHDGNDWGGGHATSDAIFGGGGDDTLDGGQGQDTLLGEDGNDLLHGDGGNDMVFGGTGADTLEGGQGNDALFGGAGDDILTGGTGSNTLTGGDGADSFVFDSSGVNAGDDVITDFDMTLVNGHTVDRLDVSDLRNLDDSPITWRDVNVTDDGKGNARLTFPAGETVVLEGVSPNSVDNKQEMVRIGLPCFATGTPILTPFGWRAVETLCGGDLVTSRDGLIMRILWAGCSQFDLQEVTARPHLLPVRIAKGRLGNQKDLLVSRQHAVVMRLADGEEVFVRAIHLARARYPGVRIAQGIRRIGYHHLLLNRHAIVNADGAAMESFYPGAMTYDMLDQHVWQQLTTAICPAGPAFVQVDDLMQVYGPPALRILTGQEAKTACASDSLHVPMTSWRLGKPKEEPALKAG